MITATVMILKQVSMDDWKPTYHSKDFEMTATLQEIEAWAQSVSKSKGCTIHDVQFSVKYN